MHNLASLKRINSLFTQIPGLILEPIVFTAIFYFLAGLKPTFYAFAMTAAISVIVINISMACGNLGMNWTHFKTNMSFNFQRTISGFFFSIAFKSVSMTIAVLVPFDVAMMVTSGIFMKLR